MANTTTSCINSIAAAATAAAATAAAATAAAAATNAPAAASSLCNSSHLNKNVFKRAVKFWLIKRAGLPAAAPKLGWLHHSS
jgi:hypothetical protein